MKIRRGLTVKQATKREILCKQIELLAEDGKHYEDERPKRE